LIRSRLQRIEDKVDSLSEGICEVQENNEMKCPLIPVKIIVCYHPFYLEPLSASGISSAIASVLSEEKRGSKLLSLAMLLNPLLMMVRLGRRRIMIMFLAFFTNL